jgi:hypothetical protein
VSDRRRWRHRIGGALKCCHLIEHVPAHVRAPFLAGSFAELLRALAINCGASDGEGLGHCRI